VATTSSAAASRGGAADARTICMPLGKRT
jgi:hypothetical protein